MIDLTKALVGVGILQAIVYCAQWWVMKKSSERQTRAYVTILQNNKGTPPGPHDSYRFWLTNCGQTPAYKLESDFGWMAFEGKNTPWPKGDTYIYNGENDGTKIILAAGDEINFYHRFGGPVKGKTFYEWIALAQNEQATVYLFGSLTYFDIFGKKRITRHCLMNQPKPGSDISCDHHNECT